MTCQEVRFIPVRFKDAYGPVGAWFLLFKSRATNALGGDYMVERKPRAGEVGALRQGQADPGQPAQLPAACSTCMEGKGPIYMQTDEAIQKIADACKDDEKARQEEAEGARERGLGRLPRHDHLPGDPLGRPPTSQPEEKPSEIAACEPYFIGSHSGASGAWVCGPEDLQPPRPREYFWGYANMSTVKGLFCAGDASGASSHKFSSGSHAEGRIAAKAAVALHRRQQQRSPRWTRPRSRRSRRDPQAARPLRAAQGRRRRDPDINPNYIQPKMFMFRLQKIMDEYAGGVSRQFTTNKQLLEQGLELLGLPEGRRREAGRREPARADALLGERPPHVAGRGPRAHHPLPRGDPVAGLLLPRRQAEDGRGRTGRSSPTASGTPRPASGR